MSYSVLFCSLAVTEMSQQIFADHLMAEITCLQTGMKRWSHPLMKEILKEDGCFPKVALIITKAGVSVILRRLSLVLLVLSSIWNIAARKQEIKRNTETCWDRLRWHILVVKALLWQTASRNYEVMWERLVRCIVLNIHIAIITKQEPAHAPVFKQKHVHVHVRGFVILHAFLTTNAY